MSVCVMCSMRFFPDLISATAAAKETWQSPGRGMPSSNMPTAELADLFALADAVVSRAGATALFELLALKKPGLLIPLPLSASRGDQILNARSFESRGFSLLLPQEKMTKETLSEGIGLLFEKRRDLIGRMENAAKMPAAQRVVAIIEEVALQGHGRRSIDA